MKGDWGPGTRFSRLHIEIDVDPNDGHVTHAGIGYELRLPSGGLHSSGYTWHSPDGEYAYAGKHADKLQEVVNEMVKAAAVHEGIEL